MSSSTLYLIKKIKMKKDKDRLRNGNEHIDLHEFRTSDAGLHK